MSIDVDHLIIGGGIAGATAAETIRARDARATVRILGAERHPLYSRVLLPHVADRRAQEKRAVLKTAADFAAKGIEYTAGAAVARVDAAARTVTLASGETLGYRTLLVATGCDARRLDVPGADLCLNFRTLEDLAPFEAAVDRSPVVVYGGGFNAMDLAMSFARRGAKVIAAMRGDGHLSRVADDAGRAAIRRTFEAHGIDVRTRVDLHAVERAGDGFVAHLADGPVRCGAVGASVGVVPNVAFLAGSGIPVASGVLTDERMHAGNGVYAAGDVAEFHDTYVGRRHLAGNWMNAMFQGKAAGENMAGGSRVFDTVTSYSIPCFELPVAVMGAIDLPDAERVSRTSDAAALRLFLLAGRVIGAACIGHFTDRAAVQALIASRKALDPAALRAVSDPRVPLASFLG